MDSSKFGLAALLTIARAEELDAVVVDDGLPRETIAEYEAAGVELIVAELAPTLTPASASQP